MSSARAERASPRPGSDANRFSDSLLAWYFVVVWGSGFIATKLGLQFAAPFTFLTLRFAFGVACMLVLVAITKPRWPSSPRQLVHIAIAGALMHVGNLGGSHYAQYLGMSAGIVALLLATQPLLTALILSAASAHERLLALQWLGVGLGLVGVALVVWHKIDLDASSMASLIAVAVALVSITAGTLYQKRYCGDVDLRSAGMIQFVVATALFAPAAIGIEGFRVAWDWRLLAAIAFLVIMASILAVNALHTLMRHGAATRVTSLLYLTPIVAVILEWMLYGVVPRALSLVGILVTCAGVALVTRTRRTVVAEMET